MNACGALYVIDSYLHKTSFALDFGTSAHRVIFAFFDRQFILSKNKKILEANIKIATDNIEFTACVQNVIVVVTSTLRTYTGDFTLGHLPDRAEAQVQ